LVNLKEDLEKLVFYSMIGYGLLLFKIDLISNKTFDSTSGCKALIVQCERVILQKIVVFFM
jgi:hypothetical protein